MNDNPPTIDMTPILAENIPMGLSKLPHDSFNPLLAPSRNLALKTPPDKPGIPRYIP